MKTKINDNVCNFIKNHAKKTTFLKADAILSKIKNRLSSIENSNQAYTKAEENTISILKNIELKKTFSHDIEHNTLLDQKCIESIMKINNMCKNKNIVAIKQYDRLLNKLEKEHIKTASQQSEKSKKETLLINNEELFNRVEESNEILKIAIHNHSKFLREIINKIKFLDGDNLLIRINKYKEHTSEILNKINSHNIKNIKTMNSTEIRQYIEELKTYDNNLNKFIGNIKNISHRYEKELEILNDNDFELPDDKILKMVHYHIGRQEIMNLPI